MNILWSDYHNQANWYLHSPHIVTIVCMNMVRTLKIYSLSKFQVYRTVLFTTLTMLSIDPQNLFILQLKVHLITWLNSFCEVYFLHCAQPLLSLLRYFPFILSLILGTQRSFLGQRLCSSPLSQLDFYLYATGCVAAWRLLS